MRVLSTPELQVNQLGAWAKWLWTARGIGISSSVSSRWPLIQVDNQPTGGSGGNFFHPTHDEADPLLIQMTARKGVSLTPINFPLPSPLTSPQRS